MAVIEDGEALLSAASALFADQLALDGVRPAKILMSQRQYDALCRWFTRVFGDGPDPQSMSIKDQFGYEDYVPIVICPDCDLFVSSGLGVIAHQTRG